MKRLIMSAWVLFMALSFSSCQTRGQSPSPVDEITENSPVIYYFHYTRRCVTCLAVEEEAKYISDVIYKGTVQMLSINLEEKEGKELARKLGTMGQGLFIVKGDISFDLTRQAFMFAMSDKDRLRNIIQEHVDPLL